jgi:hypothetical protein
LLCRILGRWVSIDAALDHLGLADGEKEDVLVLLEAGVASGLVVLNPGKVTHSIALTAAGLDVCQAAAAPKRRKPAKP